MHSKSKIKVQSIVIIGGNFAFPQGGAASNRIKCIAKGLFYHGVNVEILHLNCTERITNPNRNRYSQGIYEGIKFQYTPGTTIISSSFYKRRRNNCVGLIRGLLKLRKLSKKKEIDCVYLYDRNAKITLPIITFCNLYKIPVLLELNEWLPALPKFSRLQKLIFKKFTLKRVQGIVSISSYLSKKVYENNNGNKEIPILQVPILFDINSKYKSLSSFVTPFPCLLWCGDLNNYKHAVCFLINVFSQVINKVPNSKLALIGNISSLNLKELNQLKHQLGIPEKSLTFYGYVSDNELKELYQNAAALLLPLFYNEQDLARFPTKIAEYLSSGRPLVATKLGEITNFLTDGIDAILVDHKGGEDLFAEKIVGLILDIELSNEIGIEGQKTCFREFSHIAHGKEIIKFIHQISHGNF